MRDGIIRIRDQEGLMAESEKFGSDSIRQDQARFHKILKGKIRKNFQDYISHHSLIGKKGNDLVSIPIPRIDLPHFEFGDANKAGVGYGDGTLADGKSSGDKKAGMGTRAGNMPGEHLIEVDVTLEELAHYLGDHLQLPHLKPKQTGQIPAEAVRYKSISPSGPNSLRNFKRTFKTALRRQISSGTYDSQNPLIVPIRRDFRYRHPKRLPLPEHNAVILYMMDVSGSMGSEQKEIVRTEAFWIDLWIDEHYKHVKKKYIVHDSSAKEVSKDDFFRLKESGGTLISSAYQLCSDMIARDFPSQNWNIYCFHFSDGDNWSQEDTQLCLRILKDSILPSANMFGYGQVESRYGSGQFYRDLQKYQGELPNVVVSKIENRDAIPDSIRTFFGKK
jgi:uncharacterized sporulation protein YeaH/YhbH (DUF444 family)